jgi:hypothetical protein
LETFEGSPNGLCRSILAAAARGERHSPLVVAPKVSEEEKPGNSVAFPTHIIVMNLPCALKLSTLIQQPRLRFRRRRPERQRVRGRCASKYSANFIFGFARFILVIFFIDAIINCILCDAARLQEAFDGSFLEEAF